MRNRTISILGQETQVIYSKEGPDDGSGRHLVGLYDHVNRIIYVKDDGNKRETELTLIHECVHAVLMRVGVNQSVPWQTIETICESLSNYIYENHGKVKSRK